MRRPTPEGIQGLGSGKSGRGQTKRTTINTSNTPGLQGACCLPLLFSSNLYSIVALARILLHLLLLHEQTGLGAQPPWPPIHLPRHLVAHAGTHTAWLIPVQSNLFQTTSFGVEDATNPRERIPEVNDTQIDSRAPKGRNTQRHHLKKFDFHPNGSKSYVWNQVGLQQVLQRLLQRLQTTEARAWITIDGNISF